MSMLLTVLMGGAVSAGPAPNLTAISHIDNEPPPGTANAFFSVTRAGDVFEGSIQQNAATEWLASADKTATIGDLYEVRLTKISGTDPSGPALASWHTINTTRQWTLTQTGAGVSNFSGTLEIREIAFPTNLASASVSLTADVSL